MCVSLVSVKETVFAGGVDKFGHVTYFMLYRRLEMSYAADNTQICLVNTVDRGLNVFSAATS